MSDSFNQQLPSLPPLNSGSNPFATNPPAEQAEDELFDQLLITIQDDPTDPMAIIVDMTGPDFTEEGSPEEDRRMYYMLNMAANSLGYKLVSADN